MSNMKKSSGVGKFIAGATIGAGLGILFAPKKGSETRKDLKEKIDNVIAKIKSVDTEEVKEMSEDIPKLQQEYNNPFISKRKDDRK